MESGEEAIVGRGGRVDESIRIRTLRMILLFFFFKQILILLTNIMSSLFYPSLKNITTKMQLPWNF